MTVAELKEALEGWPDNARVAVEFGVCGRLYGGDVDEAADRGPVFVLEATAYPFSAEDSS